MTYPHAVLWIDRHEAKICHFDGESFELAKIESAPAHPRKHPSVTAERSHPADAQHYYRDVARALEDAPEILVVGPSTAKLEFVKHVHERAHGLEAKIVGVETVDHPTDGQLLAYARKYFRALTAARH